MKTLNSKTTFTFPSDLEIKVERHFDAPRELVFDAFTLPAYLTKWWAPEGQEIISCEIDLRVGGRYRFVLRQPTGAEVGFRGEYLELKRPERFVHSFIFEPYPDHGAVETLTFESSESGTLLTIVLKHKTKEGRDGMFNAGMEHGMNASHAQLDKLLVTLQP